MHSKLIFAGLGTASLAYGAALDSRDSSCSTGMTVSGSINFPVGQLSSGQARCGASIPKGTFTLSNGGMRDSQGRGCWWTPPTMTLQCDVGQEPTTGWAVGCDGTVSYQGQTTFYQCFGGVVGEYNLYLGPNAFECGPVTIKADGCHQGCPASTAAPPPPPPPPKTSVMPPPAKSSMPAPPPPPPPSTTGTATGSCPTTLTGAWEFPHLIIPIDSNKPSLAPSSSFFGEVSSTISSIFNFDIPYSDSGKTCSLVFLFPKQADLETSSFTFSGDGGVEFSQIASPAVEGQTSYASCPAKSKSFGSITIAPGNSYVVSTFPCPAGQRVGYEMSATGNTCFRYFQDYNPSPIGLYITVC